MLVKGAGTLGLLSDIRRVAGGPVTVLCSVGIKCKMCSVDLVTGRDACSKPHRCVRPMAAIRRGISDKNGKGTRCSSQGEIMFPASP